jgi:anti-sigma factor RsiW
MKCEECTASALEEFLDGELVPQRADEMSAHLATCGACALRYDALCDESAMYAGYERDVEFAPPQEMWDAVAARIATTEEVQPEERAGSGLLQRTRDWFASALVVPRFSPALTAAMMLLAIGATAFVMRYMNSQPTAPDNIAAVSQPSASATPFNAVQPTPEATPTVAPTGGSSGNVNEQPNDRAPQKPEPQRKRTVNPGGNLPANDATAGTQTANANNDQLRRQRATERLVREAESKYVAAIKMLSEDVNRKRTRLDPQVAARFDETLATIDRSIAETRRTVLQQRSSDPVAVQYMLSAYAKKVEVMREMAAVD